MTDIIADIINSNYFYLILGAAVAGAILWFYFRGKKQELPEQKFAYGKEIHNELMIKQLKKIMKNQGIKPKTPKKFMIGNEVFGYVVNYTHMIMTPSKQIGFQFKSLMDRYERERQDRQEYYDREFERQRTEGIGENPSEADFTDSKGKDDSP
jgi:hypothetical protein